MKKSFLFLSLALLLALVFCLGGCVSRADNPLDEEITEEPPDNAETFVLATGATSGNYYPFGNALAQLVENSTENIKLEVLATGGSAENIDLLGSGEAQLAIVQNDMLHFSFYGINAWAGKEPVTNTATLMALYPEICQLIVGEDTGIESVKDLAGKRVALGESNTALMSNALQVLNAYELSAEDIEPSYINFADAAQALKERKIDALFVTVGTPNKSIMDLQAERPLRIIGLDEEEIAALIEKYPFFTAVTLNESDYSFLMEEIHTLAVSATLVAAASLPEEIAYAIVKAVMEGSEEMATAHAKGAFINAERAVAGLGIQLHPGAQRYFKEIGVIK